MEFPRVRGEMLVLLCRLWDIDDDDCCCCSCNSPSLPSTTISVFIAALVVATVVIVVVVVVLSQEFSPLGCCFSLEDWLVLVGEAEWRRRTGDGIVVDVTFDNSISIGIDIDYRYSLLRLEISFSGSSSSSGNGTIKRRGDFLARGEADEEEEDVHRDYCVGR